MRQRFTDSDEAAGTLSRAEGHGPPDAMPDEATFLTISPHGSRYVGTNYRFDGPSGLVAAFDIHLTRNNTLIGPGVHLRFGHEGALVPTFFVARGSERIAEIRYNLLTGGMELTNREGERITFHREGLLLPKLTLEDRGETVLILEADRLFGKRYTAHLHPNERWSRDDLLAVLGLVFHVKVSMAILFVATGGGSSLLAPV